MTRTRNENRGEYPNNWRRISYRAKRVHGFRCERCSHPHVPARPKQRDGFRDLWENDWFEQLIHTASVHEHWTMGCSLRPSAGLGRWTESNQTGCDSVCTHGEPFITSVTRNEVQRTLTVHHLDGDKSNCALWNLAVLCQQCHLQVQAKVCWDQTYLGDHQPWMQRHIDRYRLWCERHGEVAIH